MVRNWRSSTGSKTVVDFADAGYRNTLARDMLLQLGATPDSDVEGVNKPYTRSDACEGITVITQRRNSSGQKGMHYTIIYTDPAHILSPPLDDDGHVAGMVRDKQGRYTMQIVIPDVDPASRKRQGASEQTLRTLLEHYSHMLEACGDNPAKDLLFQDVVRYFAEQGKAETILR